MARAQKEARTDEKTSLRDKGLGVAEVTALVKVYGTPDATGRKTISVEGVRSLYENARFPDEWKARLSLARARRAVVLIDFLLRHHRRRTRRADPRPEPHRRRLVELHRSAAPARTK